MGNLKLFQQLLSCQDCEFSWKGYAHGFSRGHRALSKDGRLIYIADNIWRTFPKGTAFDIESDFIELGWLPIESCPKCRSRNLSPPTYDTKIMVDVKCEEIHFAHFEKPDSEWKLTESAKTNFA